MTKVALYSTQTIVNAGFQSVLATLDDLVLSGTCTTIPEVMDHLDSERPGLLLIELNAKITLEVLNELRVNARGTAPILLVDNISMEFVSQSLALGVRGILRKTLSLSMHLECLRRVALGELWIEKELSDGLLLAKRIALTPRERQLTSLIAQGQRNKEIAYVLGISEGTVKVYLSNLFQKLGLNDRLELALFALRNMVGNQADVSEGRTPMQIGANNAFGERTKSMLGFVPSFVCVQQHPGVTA